MVGIYVYRYFAFAFTCALVVFAYVKYSPTTTTTLYEKFSWNEKRKTVIGDQHIPWMNSTESKRFSIYGDGTCKENENRVTLKEIFNRWLDLVEQNNITYFLTCGTLLGSWRNGDLVPYDTDMDVLISHHDNQKLERLKNERPFNPHDGLFHLVLQKDWKLPYNKRRRFKCDGKSVKQYSDACSFQEPLGRLMRHGNHLDIYDYTIENNMLKDPSEWMKQYPEDEIFPLVKCKFLDYTAKCPKRPRTVLESFYGKDLTPQKICRDGIWN